MKRYFSTTTQGFYLDEFEYASLPEDIVEITEEQHNQILYKINIEKKEVHINQGRFEFYDQPVRQEPLTWDLIRLKRDNLLAKTDYTQMPDWPGDSAAWAVYRQELRDIPQNFSDPNEVVWPTPPE